MGAWHFHFTVHQLNSLQAYLRHLFRFLMPKLPLSATNVIEDLFKQWYIIPAIACRNYSLSRRYATTKPNSNFHHPIQEVAVLGGGITGLTSAYYLSKALPNIKITLFEATSRLGGWLRSKTVDVGNGNIVFEQGPRSLRPNTPSVVVTLDLVRVVIPNS